MIRERQLLKIQKQRHLYDIQMMILNNSLLKNLSRREQKKIVKLVYKAEIIEINARDRQIIRINQSFDEIMRALMESSENRENEGKNPFRDDDEQ